ncbi:hypothetical protein AB1K70_18175 [Bremerella sp. JC770]|uniref:hypothetical protein n=1 Tax=Bremerella sp. JC770 TaxID=3232137 RepID=UPI003457E941
MFSRVIVTLCAVTWAVGLSGCYSSKDKWEAMRPPVYQVSGMVRMDGEPLSNAVVVFKPEEGTYSATGLSDASGQFYLTTFDDRDGAIEGTFQVSVDRVDYIPIGPEKGTSTDGGTYLPPLKQVRVTPKKYSDFEKSGFAATVMKDESNSFEFDLTSN